MKTFSRSLEAPRPPETVLAEALSSMAVPLSRIGYQVTSQGPAGITFVRRYRPWWVWLGVVLLFPLGLLLLLIRETAAIVVALEPTEDGCRILIDGRGPPEVDRAIATLAI
jgi:hypothetical protein